LKEKKQAGKYIPHSQATWSKEKYSGNEASSKTEIIFTCKLLDHLSMTTNCHKLYPMSHCTGAPPVQCVVHRYRWPVRYPESHQTGL